MAIHVFIVSQRRVIPEILDQLPVEDPEAIRSRRDLRRINMLMGNERWICRTLAKHESATYRITEIGAGDGVLCARLASLYPRSLISAYDLAPRPESLASSVKWYRGDLFENLVPEPGGVLIANLFLHHFEAQALNQLGDWVKDFELLVFCEPDRARVPHLLGGLMHPWINKVTQYDMHISIQAGFQAGEIRHFLKLNPTEWQGSESCTWRGARRVVFWR